MRVQSVVPCLLVWLTQLAGTGAVVAFGEPGHPVVVTYGAQDLGVVPHGRAMRQGGAGALYFGSSGLTTFDGAAWKTFPAGENYLVFGLDVGSDGRVWAAAKEDLGWFAREPGGAYRFVSLRARVPASAQPLGDVQYVLAADGRAMFVSQDQILWWDGAGFVVRRLPGARRLVGLRVGRDWFVYHSPTGLYRVVGTNLVPILPASRLPPGSLLLGMYRRPAPETGLLLVTTEGLAVWRGDVVQPIAPAASAFAREYSLSCVARLHDGRLALGTLSGGVLLLTPQGGIDRTLDVATGLPTNQVYSLGEDGEHGLWINSPNNLCRVALGDAAEVCGPAEGLPDRPIDALAAGPDGSVAVATDAGLFLADAGANRFHAVPQIEGVESMFADDTGIWISRHHGVDRLVGSNLRPFWRTIYDVFSAVPSRLTPGRVIVSAGGGEVVELDSARPPAVRTLARPSDTPFTLAEGADGRIWMGTMMAGMLAARAQDGSVVPAQFRSGRVLTAADRNGDVFAFSPQGGAILSKGSAAFTPIAGYPRRPAAAVAAGGADDVWVAYAPDHGLGACVARIHGGRWLPTAIEGLPSVGTPRAIFARAQGRRVSVWVGGTTGLIRALVDPAAAAAAAPPAPRLEVLRPSPRSDSATLSFSVPSLARRSGFRLDSWIQGVDTDWTPVGPEETRILSGLRDGRFLVRARVVAETGLAGPEASAVFTVPPPAWRTPAGLAAEAAAAGALLFALYRLRVGQLRRRNRQLEAAVEQRTGQALRAQEEAERANAAKSEFVARVSHNIRNPLHGLSGLSLALENTPLDARQKEYVAAIQGCASSLSLLLDDVLEFAQIEAGRIALHPEAFAPEEVLEAVAAALQIEARQRCAHLAVSVDPRIASALVADRGRVQEILMNYATNALKYAGGGRIDLGVRLVADAPEEIEYFVSDEGPGFTPEQRNMLFTLFSRLGQGREQAAGTGLGLALCRRLADLMDGSVGVDSTPGQGATFFLRLPFITAPRILVTEPIQFYFRRVLLVEDVAYNVWATSAVLQRLGIQVAASAGTGEDALREFQSTEYDLVVLDRHLPDCDGIEVARRMRASEGEARHATILALTAFATAEDRAACLEAGMDGFVGKPLTPEKLRFALTRLGDEHRPGPSVVTAPQARPFDPSLLRFLSGASAPDPIERLAKELEAEVSVFQRHRQEEDWIQTRAAAHRLLGLAEMVSAAELAAAARNFQEAAHGGASDLLPALADEVAGQARGLIEVLNRAAASPQTA